MNRVLIVDDEPANARLLQRILELEGDFECLSTQDPREALPMCETSRPDLVLLDLNMPHLDGIALLGMFAERLPRRTLLPVIVLTADATQATKHQAMRAGASDFLTKPFDLVEVVLRVRQQLERRRLHARITEESELLETPVSG